MNVRTSNSVSKTTRLGLAAALAVGLMGGTAVVAAGPAGAQEICDAQYAGSLSKEAPDASAASIAGVGTGWNECYSTLIIDLAGPADGYLVQYVDQVHREGSGEPVPVRGGAVLQVVPRSPTYDPYTGEALWSPADPNEVVDVSTDRTIEQVAYAGSFEGQTTFAVGVRARLPFSVYTQTLDDGNGRLVIEIAHAWGQ